MWQNERCDTLEIIDLGPDHYTPTEYDRCLSLLNRVNWLLGGYRASRVALKKLKRSPESILDVGCGGGYQCHLLHQWFPQAEILGIDISKGAIEHAQKKITKNVSFKVQEEKSLPYPDNHFDVVTSMLVCHHMKENELITFIKECVRISHHAVIINDLQRHILGYLSFRLIAPFLFRNRLILSDGPLSVKRSFRKSDLITLLEKAGIKKHQFTIKWNFPFRWTVTIVK